MALYGKEELLVAQPSPVIRDILGVVPSRWGRMSPLSRMILVEVVLLVKSEKMRELQGDEQRVIGLVGGTARGSLSIDQEFIASMDSEMALASPALFGYTLANIPLAEAAIAANLTGPVYAVFSEDSPLQQARDEAEILLESMPGLDMMIACSFDHIVEEDFFAVSVELVTRD